MALKKSEREQLFNKYNGHCAYCGCELQKGWHADHIEPIQRNYKYDTESGTYKQDGTALNPERDNLENMNPSCASCNIMKSSGSLEGFRKMIKGFIASLNRDSTQYKFAKRYGLITETDIEVKFYFELTPPNRSK